MSTVGLRKVGNYEEALARATKDEQHVEGTINPYLANAATRIINNPEFQRVKDRMMDDLEQQQRAHLDQRNFETHVHGLATEARINRSDLQYLIENLQQPPPAPVPAPPQTDAAADRERLLAELDGLVQEREARARQEMTAHMNARDLAASRVETPAQQIVREYHQTPIYIPTPHTPPQQPIHIVTPQQDWSGMMNQFGLSMRELFLRHQQAPAIHINLRHPPGEIPIEYTAGQPPPPPPPGAGAIQRSYGPAKLPKSRYEPFQNAPHPPPPPGGVTAPMPVEERFPRGDVPIRREYFPPAPPPAPPPYPPQKRKGPTLGGGSKHAKHPRFQGEGHRLPEPQRFQPFQGQAQRIPMESAAHGLRANAIQRMRELAERGAQAHQGRETIDRMNDLGRALRRGGAPGDVADPGKRKRGERRFVPNPRRRVGDRPPGPQTFTLA